RQFWREGPKPIGAISKADPPRVPTTMPVAPSPPLAERRVATTVKPTSSPTPAELPHSPASSPTLPPATANLKNGGLPETAIPANSAPADLKSLGIEHIADTRNYVFHRPIPSAQWPILLTVMKDAAVVDLKEG